jgi:D-sedoheptulose 7-phosphate isomerase
MLSSMRDVTTTLDAIVGEHIAVARETRRLLVTDIAALAADLCMGFERGGRLVVFGNGGSAADAQHFAAELTGRFMVDRPPLPAIALTADTTALTAIANDYGYDQVFSRQVRAACGPADVVVGISTSGASPSIANGVAAAREQGSRTWAMTGGTGGLVMPLVDRAIVVPSSVTARIQEMHLLIIHAICVIIDDWWTAGGRLGPRA